ncbi:hypothetical protein [Pseudomonas asplenii]|uniref:hypothetical protein n=1 Tax=Pseudomonas asplenii TaxID=53407 RepID=UPI0006B5AE7A|nr:hypothetical protein [Pseudomonas fuscovaginae]KPA95999.1 hypothetical protein PF70_03977 [Pseudomonas fuscovaginae]
MLDLERKKADFAHRGVKANITYFVSTSGAVPRFDVYATLSNEEKKIGASIDEWATEGEALNAAKTLATKFIDKHLLDQ